MFIRDAAAATSREVTPEGFLRVRARIGRAGLHNYTAAELGTPAGFAPGDTVRVWRPADEVFDPASMASFGGKPVTDDHPPVMVTSRNWKQFAIGHCAGSVGRDEDDHLVTDLHIADAAAAERALAGAELSNGYHADFVFEPGTTPDGEPYDAIQRNIRGNHVALVRAGRCGSTCRVGDAAVEAGCSCGEEPAQELSAAAETPASSGPDPAVLDALVQDRLAVLDGARRLIGATFDGRGRSTPAIRRLAVARTLGQARIEGRDDAYVAAAFDALVAGHRPGNPLADHLAAPARTGPVDRAAALAARNHHLTRAWKGDAQGDR